MTIVEKKYSDLQEINLWQQLNRQLVELRERGISISDDNQKALQGFCFANNLFKAVTSDPILDDIPISLVTDFSRIMTLTYNSASWNECLRTLLPTTQILDIERAQADAFDAMTGVEKKFGISESPPEDIDSDDDAELYAFIDEYNGVIEKQGWEPNNALRNAYELKADVIGQIHRGYGGQVLIQWDGTSAFLDFKGAPDENQILATYQEGFCKAALSSISRYTMAAAAFHYDMEILALFEQKKSEPQLKKSISDFIQHEWEIFAKQRELIDNFGKVLQTRLNSTDICRINVIDISPFRFLESPFPEV